ncbi:MAG: hypothetical protein ACRCVT_02390 [Leadbetterella sp.]
MKIKICSFLFLFSLYFTAKAQNFLDGFDRFSSKKVAYITLQDGTKLEGDIEDLDRKKGNISEITIRVDGKKKTFEPEQIKEMYLPATGLDMVSKKMEAGTNLTKDLNMDKIADGYGFFEFTEVVLKGKVKPLLMQLVNPGFHNKIKVYFDPFAKETMSMGVGPLKVGGIDKSYFVKVGDKPAYKVSKGDYDDQAQELFKDSPEAMAALKKESDWNKFDKIVYAHFLAK